MTTRTPSLQSYFALSEKDRQIRKHAADAKNNLRDILVKMDQIENRKEYDTILAALRMIESAMREYK